MMKRFCRRYLFFLLLLSPFAGSAQELPAGELFDRLRHRLYEVQDYVADVRMRIDVSFMRIPTLYGKLYFKNPDKLKLERNGGISILPKRSVSLTLNNLVPAGEVTVIDAGKELLEGRSLRVLKVVPDDDASDIILTKLWVDEERQLALRTETTTRENGTISMDLRFGKYASVALPDQVIFHLDVKEFKVPKGVTMDYDEGAVPESPAAKRTPKGGKGTIRIDYLSYRINTGLGDEVFRDLKK